MLPTTLVHKKFPSQNDKLVSFFHNSETPCIVLRICTFRTFWWGCIILNILKPLHINLINR